MLPQIIHPTQLVLHRISMHFNSAPTLYDVADQTQFVNDNFKLAREEEKEERREQLNLASAAAAPPIHPSEKCQNVMIRGELRNEQVCGTVGGRGRKKRTLY